MLALKIFKAKKGIKVNMNDNNEKCSLSYSINIPVEIKKIISKK